MNLPADIELQTMQYDENCCDRWQSYLSASEAERMNGFGSPKRRREFLLGRAAARSLLARRLALAPEDVPLFAAASGAPEVEIDDLYVSLAHSHGRAAAVVSACPVGIDLERIQPRRRDLYRYILHPDEMDLFEALPCEHHERQILCWTLKEATVKALCTGFRIPPKEVRIDLDFDRQTARVTTPASETVWQVLFDKQDDFYLAVAYE